MFGRARDQWVLQAQRADGDFKYAPHVASRRLSVEAEHSRSIARDHFMDILVVVAEVHAERDAPAETFERREHADRAEVRTDHRLLDAGRLDVMAEVFARRDLELRALQEHADRVL